MKIPEIPEAQYNKLVSDYERKTAKSKKLHEEAKKYIVPMGVHTYTTWHRPYPLFIDKALGSRVTDVDGNAYIDLFLDNGVSFIGHNPPKVREKIAKTMEKYGIHLQLCEELQIEWAKKITKHYPSCQKLKVVNTGNEATELAAQIARAYTGRNIIIKLQGHHHGWNAVLSYDALVPGTGTFFTKGIPENHWENIIAVPANDIDGLEKTIKQNPKKIAAVIMEPMGEGTGSLPLKDGYQKEVRKLTQENDVLLIFDEVASGFRVALGGAQELLGIKADITCLGKHCGGGIPVGVVGGRDDIMSVVGSLDPKAEHFGPVFPMGAFCLHPLAMAGGIAIIEELEQGNYFKNATLRAEQLVKGINKAAGDLKIPLSASNTYTVTHYSLAIEYNINDMDTAMAALNFNQMVRFGLLLSDPGAVVGLPGNMYICGVLTEEDINKAIFAFENCFKLFKT